MVLIISKCLLTLCESSRRALLLHRVEQGSEVKYLSKVTELVSEDWDSDYTADQQQSGMIASLALIWYPESFVLI